MATTAISGIITPDILGAATIPADLLTMARSIEPSVIPRFRTVAARNTAFTSAVLTADPLGGEGLRCYILDSGMWEYDGYGWVPCGGPRNVATFTANSGQTAGQAANGGVTYIVGINGQTYQMNRTRACSVTMNAVVRCDTVNSQFRVHVQSAGNEFFDWRDDFDIANGPGAKWFQPRSGLFTVPAGQNTMSCTVELTSGGGIISVSTLAITVVDEGPA